MTDLYYDVQDEIFDMDSDEVFWFLELYDAPTDDLTIEAARDMLIELEYEMRLDRLVQAA